MFRQGWEMHEEQGNDSAEDTNKKGQSGWQPNYI
jgi:hypothetical protein